MPILTRYPRRSALGTGARMSPTGWPTPGPSRTGKLVSPPMHLDCGVGRERSGAETLVSAASSMIAVGLSWRMAIGACVLGNTIMGLVITVNGRIGATVGCILPQRGAGLTWNSFTLRSPFSHACHLATTSATLSLCPVASSPLSGSGEFGRRTRSNFRRLIARSVQTTTGGQCMTVLLTAIWPSFAHIPNHIPASEGITTSEMIGFFLYFLLQLPFLCIPYTKVWPCS